MIILLLKILEGYNEYGEEIGFTKSEIDKLFKKYFKPDKEIKCNERGLILLWDENYISNEIFADNMDAEYEDGKFWLVFGGFYDIIDDFPASILDSTYDWDYGSYSDSYSIDDIKTYYWDEYDEKTLQEIINYCVKNEIELDDTIMTNENTIIEDGDIYFNDELFTDYLEEDELDDFVFILKAALSDAYNSAEMDAAYKATKEQFIKDIGNYKWKTVKNQKGETSEKLYIDVSNVDFNELESNLKDFYGAYEFEDERYGDLYYMLRDELDYFKFRAPDYNYLYVDIDKETLNEYTRDRLQYD